VGRHLGRKRRNLIFVPSLPLFSAKRQGCFKVINVFEFSRYYYFYVLQWFRLLWLSMYLNSGHTQDSNGFEIFVSDK
jgi:hypothetical protein